MSASDVAAAISAAATEYQDGNDNLANRLHANSRVIGSEKNEHWTSREDAEPVLKAELAEIRNQIRSVNGPLVDLAKSVNESEVTVRGDIAWWAVSGDITMTGFGQADGVDQQASWTVALERIPGAGWQIVHSHFSIHR